MKTVGDVEHATYFDACRALDLIEDDEIWRKTLNEAFAEYLSFQLIRLFGYILIFNQVGNPAALWEEFRPKFIEEFKLRSKFT